MVRGDRRRRRKAGDDRPPSTCPSLRQVGLSGHERARVRPCRRRQREDSERKRERLVREFGAPEQEVRIRHVDERAGGCDRGRPGQPFEEEEKSEEQHDTSCRDDHDPGHEQAEVAERCERRRHALEPGIARRDGNDRIRMEE